MPDVDLHAIARAHAGLHRRRSGQRAQRGRAAVRPCPAPQTDRQPRHRRGHRSRDERPEAQVQGPWPLDELRNTAYHEGGHALVAAALHHTDPGHQDHPSLPRGLRARLHGRHADRGPLLAVAQPAARPDGVRDGRSRHRRGDRLPTTPTTGASNDIEKATAIARKMVVEYGFSSQLGAIKWADDDDQTTVMDGLQPRKYSDRTAEIIDRRC